MKNAFDCFSRATNSIFVKCVSFVGATVATLFIAPFAIAIFALVVAACGVAAIVTIVLIVFAIIYYSFINVYRLLLKLLYSF